MIRIFIGHPPFITYHPLIDKWIQKIPPFAYHEKYDEQPTKTNIIPEKPSNESNSTAFVII